MSTKHILFLSYPQTHKIKDTYFLILIGRRSQPNIYSKEKNIGNTVFHTHYSCHLHKKATEKHFRYCNKRYQIQQQLTEAQIRKEKFTQKGKVKVILYSVRSQGFINTITLPFAVYTIQGLRYDRRCQPISNYQISHFRHPGRGNEQTLAFKYTIRRLSTMRFLSSCRSW